MASNGRDFAGKVWRTAYSNCRRPRNGCNTAPDGHAFCLPTAAAVCSADTPVPLTRECPALAEKRMLRLHMKECPALAEKRMTPAADERMHRPPLKRECTAAADERFAFAERKFRKVKAGHFRRRSRGIFVSAAGGYIKWLPTAAILQGKCGGRHTQTADGREMAAIPRPMDMRFGFQRPRLSAQQILRYRTDERMPRPR